jgi:proline iminopeptidase
MLIPVDDAQLYCERLGSGTPLVALHGGLGLDHTYLRPWLDPLAGSFDLTFVDQRGCGRSLGARAIEEVTHETWAADVEALRGALGFDRFVLFGHSYGSFIALEYALRYGNRLSGLVLCEVAPAVDYPDVIVRNAQERAPTPAVFNRVATTFGRPVGDDAELKDLWSEILPLYFFEFDRRRADEMNARMQFSAGAFNQSNCRCLPKYNVLERLKEIRVPTLVLAGRHDWILPVKEGAERVHHNIAGSELLVFERTGHFPFIEQQGAFLSAMRGFERRTLPAA